MAANQGPRHQALAVTTAGRDDPDFDFLDQPASSRRRRCSASLLRPLLFSIVIVVLFVWLVVELTHGNRGEDKPVVELASCFFPLGGGETRLILNQTRFPRPECVPLYDEYFKEGGQYWKDTEAAIADAEGLLEQPGSYNKTVLLDIDETSLSNLPAYRESAFGPTLEQLNALVRNAGCIVIPATLGFYQKLRNKGFSVTFLTGRKEEFRNGTIANLELAGFGTECKENPAAPGVLCYRQLILREQDDNRDAVLYKGEVRGNLMEEGVELVASIGDQWSDLLGEHRPLTLIKMPTPLYYIP